MNKIVSESILGVNADVLTSPELIAHLNDDIINHRKVRIVAINPEKIIKCRKDQKLRLMINGFDYHIADGVGVLLASYLHGGKIRKRVTGIDTMTDLCLLADQNHYRIFIYGSKPEVLDQTIGILKLRYPNMILCGSMDGYQQDQNLILSTINQAKPDILFVALGSPKQENWITSSLSQLQVSVAMGVGGSFDVISENKERAPLGFRKLGLEWFYRLLIEPSRLFRQTNLVVFLFLIMIRWGKGYRQ